MTVTDLQGLFDYGYWANRKIFGVASQLSTEQFTQSVAGSYGSVRNTMVHIMSAEWGWLDRCGGARRGAQLKADDFPTLQSITDTWTSVEAHVRQFLSTLRDEDLTRTIEFAIGSGPKHTMPLGVMMHHAAVHAVHHRGQVALLLRVLGYTPGNFDLVIYYGETHGGPAF